MSWIFIKPENEQQQLVNYSFNLISTPMLILIPGVKAQPLAEDRWGGIRDLRVLHAFISTSDRSGSEWRIH